MFVEFPDASFAQPKPKPAWMGKNHVGSCEPGGQTHPGLVLVQDDVSVRLFIAGSTARIPSIPATVKARAAESGVNRTPSVAEPTA